MSTTLSDAPGMAAVASDGRPLRIAVIGPRGIPSNYSGVERIVEELFDYIAARGHHVTVYCRPGVLDAPTGTHKGIRLVRTPSPGGKNFETLSHSLFSTIHATIRGDVHEAGKTFDLISLHTIAPGLFTPIARLAGIPVVNHVHGLDWQREKWRGMGSRVLRRCERTMVRHATRIVGVNRDIVDYYRNTYGLDVPLLPNGVNSVADDFQPDRAVLDRFGLDPNRYVVCIGRLVPEKRIHDTIAAFKNVPGDSKLVFVGEGKHSPEYVSKIHEQAKADPRVVFTGIQSGSNLETLFRSARLYVTASELEGLPSSLLECMERQIPAVASDIPPHRELLGKVDGYDWFFPVGDVSALTRRITDALVDEHGRKLIGQAERRFVREHYSWPACAEATLRLYQRTVVAAAV